MSLFSLPRFPTSSHFICLVRRVKQVKVWEAGTYLNNFVQAVMDTFPKEELEGSTIVVSGDGRSVSCLLSVMMFDVLIRPSVSPM